MVDLPLLIAAVSADSPCGEDLEYDSSFLELERAAQGLPERQMGDAVLAAEPPEWRKVRDLAAGLFGRSKDLRIANYLVQSAVALDGLPGLTRGLALVRELLERYWDGLYPRLDSEDDNDPTFRLNALRGLVADTQLQLLRDAPLVRSRAFGTVSLRAALNAAGLQRFASETLNLEQVAGAFQNGEAGELERTRAALAEAQAHLAAIESLVSERVDAAEGIDLAPLKQLIRLALQLIDEHAPQLDGAPAGMADAGATASDAQPHDASRAGDAPAAPRVSAEIASRDDVLKTLDRILAYYASHEPSSPVPVLLSRAKTLVTADFAAIVRNLIPDGLSQFENLRGPGSE
ncbi:type VI secretion system protein TssA [Pseudomonas sp. GCM10022186]|uniref:type VI secretion system protein TssA n=1 Tax=Pseudomonas sp. GCM10022186 TaxID=3252650 RepID=UPI00361F88D3